MVNKRKKGVMNNATEISKQIAEVSPLSLVGESAMGFPDKISTVRGQMATNHATQRVVLSDPEYPMIFTGAENEFGSRSSWDIRAKDDYQLMKVFRKFKDFPNSTVAYIFKNLRTGKYKCEVVHPVVNLIEKYGFRMKNCITNYMEGDIIPEGTPIAQSSSYVKDNYCAGRNLRYVYAVLPELTEDSLVISDKAAESLKYDMVDIVTVKVDKDAFLLNKYGTNGLYKPFPDIGEEIQNNILCSIRENSYISSVSEASIPHINDTNYYSHGIVADIDIATNTDVENEQFNYYLKQIRDWYSDIYSYISTIVVDKYQDDTTLLDIYHQAEKYLNNSVWVTKEYIADTIITFTVLQPTPIRVGQKVVGRYGNKSVISKIIPSELMPKTDDGRPIDMLANALAVPNRIIAFATYESSMTFQMERMYQHIKKMNDDGASRDEIVTLAAEFVSIFNPSQGSDIIRLYNENPDAVFKDIIDNGFFIQIKPFNEVCIRDALLESYEKYADIMKPYDVYTKLRHRWIKLDEQYPVGYQYTWVLKQEPSKAMSALSTGRTTLYDLPVKTRQYNKNLRHYSDNPIKFGEYDTYNFLAGVGVKDFAKISTYYRGSQYEENSVLMSQLNNIGIDTTKYNKFPQLDNLKNILKLLGVKLKPDIFGYATIGNVDELQDILVNNVSIRISIPDLRYVLIMHSYYLQYEEYLKGPVDMVDFLNKIDGTNLFEGCSEEYINSIYKKFVELLPILQQLKQYK
jgi:hypothetical protein